MGFLLWLSCANSGLGQDPVPEEVSCPFEGQWSLVDVNCGAFAASEFFERYDTATLVFSSGATGCDVEASLLGPFCTSIERWSLSDALETDPTRFSLTSNGIAGCEPAECAFDDGATPCLVGEFAGSREIGLERVDRTLLVTGAFDDQVDCPLGLETSFLGPG